MNFINFPILIRQFGITQNLRMSPAQSQLNSLGLLPPLQKMRQHVKETKQRITEIKQYQNPGLMKRIKQLQKQIHRLSYSTINDVQKEQVVQQYSQKQKPQNHHRNDSAIREDQRQLEILENIVKNKFTQSQDQNMRSHHVQSKRNQEQKEDQDHLELLRFLQEQPQNLIQERLAHSRLKHGQNFSDKKYSQLNKYLTHKKALYQKMSSLKPGTNLYTSHQRVMLKQYLDWFRKWNQDLVQKIQLKSSVHKQFLQAKNVYLNSCKKLATLILQQKKQQQNNQILSKEPMK